jgi:hypothetical protein
MRYYEDSATGSIYSLAELERLFQGSGSDLQKLLGCLKLLPYSTCCLLEEAEAVAAQTDQEWRRRWLRLLD